MLILCPMALLNLPVGLLAFLCVCISWDFLHIGSPVNKYSFISSFPIRMALFQWGRGLIPLARTSSTMLNRNGKSEHPALFPILGKIFILSPLSIMHTEVFVDTICQDEWVPIIQNLLKVFKIRDFPGGQRLRLHAPNARGLRSIPGRELDPTCMPQLRVHMPHLRSPPATTKEPASHN